MSGFWKGKTCLVTGATGFLGGSLVAELLAQGAEVVALVRDMVPQSRFQATDLASHVKVVRGPLEDYDVVERALGEYGVDTVFHLAAQAIVGVANRSPLSTFESNIKGTWVLLEACRRLGMAERIVIASSDKAYGDHDTLPYREDFALQGRHPYDVSKSCADLIALSYAHSYALPVSITRCGNLFGPGGQRPVIRSDGSPVRDYVFVEDIVQAYLLLAEHMGNEGVVGRAFNFGTGEPVSALDLTRRTLAAAGRLDLEPHIQNKAHGEIQAQYLSSSLAHEKLGWAPGAGLDERLSQTFLWYRDHRHFF